MTTQIVTSDTGAADLEVLLHQAQDRIADVLPAHIHPQKMITVAMDLVRGDSAIQACLTSKEGQVSILQSVLEASQLGLMFGKHLGHAYLVAFKDGKLSELAGTDVKLAQMMIGYRGFIHLMKKGNSDLVHVYSRIVWPHEAFDIQEGAHRALIHTPDLDVGTVSLNDQGQIEGIRGAYTMMIYKESSGIPADFEWMPLVEIEKRHQASKAKNGAVPWARWTEEMVRKCPTRHAAKRMELTPEMTKAIVRDEYREVVQLDTQTGELSAPRMAMPRRLSEGPPVATPPATQPEEPPADVVPPQCPEHGAMPLIPAGQTKAGRAYPAFYGCERGCKTKGINQTKWIETLAKNTAEKAEKPKEEKAKPAAKGKAKDQATSAALGAGYITAGQIKEVMEAAADVGIDETRLQQMLNADGIDSPEEIKAEEFAGWIKRLEGLQG